MFLLWKIMFSQTILNCYVNKLINKIYTWFLKIEMISDKIKTYTCLSCLNNITKGKKNHASINHISGNKIISYVTKLKCLK